MNETEMRKTCALEVPARNVRATSTKTPKAARNSPIPACILLKPRLRLAKINALVCVFHILPSFFGAGHLEKFLQRIIQLAHFGD